ncbi:iron(III) transport system ATP-binding protein [Paenibacillus sp. UNCCL117]|uniref:ABC transporter ATP-binding protein n=1 Tax=unclassified Paenibacillus TaxID=185978 RepID=UPI000882EC0D|nr:MULTISPECIES: ABC transporter ATP-binding protein [unclassified Paenibacillus]SDD03604.1 iron(III) transport system ATP-binding protein [Paenibacillus sp. cl123]SFW32273.1 iron(III) transport system ATP-binding protein [Paenibacillus sp. UNCCL117]
MITFHDIQIKFGSFHAIQNLNLQINEGEFFTFLGPSGCGKTTILRSLVGFITPTSGEIRLSGKDITHVPIEKRGISMVFQSYALFPTMNVYENIAFGMRVKKASKSEVDREVRDIAQKVDLKEGQLFKKVSELSGGQQQRVAIARALVLKPSILALDEPLSNLDAKLRVQLRNELKNLQKKFGITTIYVTHDQEEALTLSDRIAVFNNGIVEQVGTPQEVYNQSQTEFVCNFIGDINKIDPQIIQNSRLKEHLDASKVSYIRNEKVSLLPLPGQDSVELKGRIVDKEFYGLYSKFVIEVNGGGLLKTIEKESGTAHYQVGDELTVYVDSSDILQY